ncbi:MAG: long-chain fatty acid--CoA ligase [Treponemataceae bacterium]|nr:long-chain fatty acid--CoA ligase [Treponemataceae bacterium]
MKNKKIEPDRTLPKNIPLMVKQRAELCPEICAQAAKNKEGKFLYYSFADLYKDFVSLALALYDIGVRRNDHVAVFSDNCREWLLTDLAVLSLGAADVPRGCDSMANELQYILSFSECKSAVFENDRQFNKAVDKKENVPLLKSAIFFNPPSDDTVEKALSFGIDVFRFKDLLEKGHALYVVPGKKELVEEAMESTEGNDLATILFTSGTTGVPKGVMLTHRNYMAQMEVVHHILTVKPGDMWLTVLPVWHSFERCLEYMALTLKSGIAYSKPISSVMLSDFSKIRPQWMCGVPRLWESLAKGVNRAMKKEGGLKYALFSFFISAGTKYAWAKERITGRACRFSRRPRIFDFIVGIFPFIGLWIFHALGELLVYRKIRDKLGGRITAAISGGGALQHDTDCFYRAIGFKLLEGYGITEAAPVLSVRNIHKPRPGCVGEIYPSCQVKIVAEKNGVPLSPEPLASGCTGLVLAKGDQIMKGYYKMPELTASVIDKDGWLNTGDLGKLTYDGEIKITGRAKDTIVLLNGENIEPLGIETALCGSPYIETAVVFGQDEKFLGALIVGSKQALESYAEENNISCNDYEELITRPEIEDLIRYEIDTIISASNGFKPCERIFRFSILGKSFEIGKELSAKQEFMRHKVAEIYRDKITEMFD